MGKKLIAVIMAVVALAVIIAIVVIKPFSNTSSEKKIAKTWYSDRKENDMLTLSKDGSYTGSDFLLGGTYQLKDGILTCQGMLDGAVNLLVTEVDGKTKLFFDNGSHSFYFHDTKEAAEEAIAAMAVNKVDEAEQAVENLPEILQDTWISTDGLNTTLTFSEDEYTIVFPGIEDSLEPETRVNGYEILEITYENKEYFIKVEVTEEDGYTGPAQMKLTEKDGVYIIGSMNFAFCWSFEKQMERGE